MRQGPSDEAVNYAVRQGPSRPQHKRGSLGSTGAAFVHTSSSTAQPAKVIAALEGVSKTARTLAAEHLGLALDADRAIDAVKWSVQGGKVTEFPGLYATELEGVRARLASSKPSISSAQSTIQMIVSGAASTGIQAALVTLGSPLTAAPTFQRQTAQDELDTRMRSLWGSDELGVRRRGAWTTLALGTPEASVQACHTAREILTVILDRYASNELVKKAPWWEADAQTRDGVSKRHKIRFLAVCTGNDPFDPGLLDELDSQVDRAFEAHGRAISLAHPKTPGSSEAARAAIADLEEVLLTLLRYRSALGQCP